MSGQQAAAGEERLSEVLERSGQPPQLSPTSQQTNTLLGDAAAALVDMGPAAPLWVTYNAPATESVKAASAYSDVTLPMSGRVGDESYVSTSSKHVGEGLELGQLLMPAKSGYRVFATP